MLWWQAALWALAGGFVVEGLEFAALVRRHRLWPWEVDAKPGGDTSTTAAGPAGYFIGEVVRLAAGGVLGAALAGQITAPLPALAIGAAAPVVAGNLLAFVPLPSTPPPTDAAGGTDIPRRVLGPSGQPEDTPFGPATPWDQPVPAPQPKDAP